jgi:hypothetical protein
VHVDWPVTFVNDPAKQAVHAVAVDTLANLPFAHGVHFTPSKSRNEPNEHDTGMVFANGTTGHTAATFGVTPGHDTFSMRIRPVVSVAVMMPSLSNEIALNVSPCPSVLNAVMAPDEFTANASAVATPLVKHVPRRSSTVS